MASLASGTWWLPPPRPVSSASPRSWSAASTMWCMAPRWAWRMSPPWVFMGSSPPSLALPSSTQSPASPGPQMPKPSRAISGVKQNES